MDELANLGACDRRLASAMPPERRQLPVSELLLDPDNPRLPEELQGGPQGELLTYLNNEAVLDELVRSLNDNGFFDHEPLIAHPSDRGRYVVLEGNRRLAALKVILGEPDALDQGIYPVLDSPPSKQRIAELRQVPVYVVDDRDEVHRYLGFRHIGGIKTWSAEAKARYLLQESEKAAERNAENPFLLVARRVGSNTQGVRNSYTALALLRHARDEFDIPITYVTQKRFGVWLRCMTATDVRHYVGLNGARTYEAVREQIGQTDGDNLREVLLDLQPVGGERRPLLNDSRDVTVYGQILHNTVAHDVMRRYRDLGIARQIVELAALPERIEGIRNQVEVAREEAQDADHSDELENAADSLFRSARSLRAAVVALKDDD